MRKLKLGLAGCGVIGRRHLEAAIAADRIDVVAVADLDPQAAQAAADTADGDVAVHTSADELIADPNVDALVLAMPTGARSGVARQAVEAGKHVLLEKPPAMSTAELIEIQSAVNGQVVACASSRMRHFDSCRQAAAFLDDKPLGPIRLVRIRGLISVKPRPQQTPPAWRLNHALNGGGIMVNWGIYDLDYMLGILRFNVRPTSVFSQAWGVADALSGWVAPGSDAETHGMAMIRCEDDLLVHIERGEYLASPDDMAWQIIGEHGGLRMHMTPAEGKQLLFDRVDAQKGLVTDVVWEGTETGSGMHAGPLNDFADAVLDGTSPATGLEEAILLQRILDGIYASARQGQEVAVTL